MISIHALLAESDWRKVRRHTFDRNFYPRSPCGERRRQNRCGPSRTAISIHALLAESDNIYMEHTHGGEYFYPRSPCGERLVAFAKIGVTQEHFYPRSPCGERRDYIISNPPYSVFLSTLSLRRATIKLYVLIEHGGHFYPRSPCGERHSAAIKIIPFYHFYPRSPCGERQPPKPLRPHPNNISIHALLAESDNWYADLTISYNAFLSTLSLRRATN